MGTTTSCHDLITEPEGGPSESPLGARTGLTHGDRPFPGPVSPPRTPLAFQRLREGVSRMHPPPTCTAARPCVSENQGSVFKTEIVGKGTSKWPWSVVGRPV